MFGAAAAAILFAVTYAFEWQAFEAFHRWTRAHESLQLDEWLPALCLLLLGMAADGVRRLLREQREQARTLAYRRLLQDVINLQARTIRDLTDLQQKIDAPNSVGEVDLASVSRKTERMIQRGYRSLDMLQNRTAQDKRFDSLLLGDFEPEIDPTQFERSSSHAESVAPDSKRR